MFTAFLAYAADTLPESRRTQGLAYYGLSGLIPVGAASVLAEVILDRWEFVGLFRVAFGCVAVSWFLVWWLPRRPTDELGTLPRRSVLAAFLQRDLIPLWVIALVFAVAVNVLFTYMRTFVDASGVGSVGLFFGVLFGERHRCEADCELHVGSIWVPKRADTDVHPSGDRTVRPVRDRLTASLCGSCGHRGFRPRNRLSGPYE